MLHTLIHGAMQSTTQGFIGVSLIFIYMAVIIFYALKRIKEGDHLDHH